MSDDTKSKSGLVCVSVFSILGHQSAERHAPLGEREYEARIVFASNSIHTASGVAPHEMFQEASSALVAMASINAVLAVFALKGWPTKARGAAGACIQQRTKNIVVRRLGYAFRNPSDLCFVFDKWLVTEGVHSLTASAGPVRASRVRGHLEKNFCIHLGKARIGAHRPSSLNLNNKKLSSLAVYEDNLLMTVASSDEKEVRKASEARVNF